MELKREINGVAVRYSDGYLKSESIDPTGLTILNDDTAIFKDMEEAKDVIENELSWGNPSAEQPTFVNVKLTVVFGDDIKPPEFSIRKLEPNLQNPAATLPPTGAPAPAPEPAPAPRPIVLKKILQG